MLKKLDLKSILLLIVLICLIVSMAGNGFLYFSSLSFKKEYRFMDFSREVKADFRLKEDYEYFITLLRKEGDEKKREKIFKALDQYKFDPTLFDQKGIFENTPVIIYDFECRFEDPLESEIYATFFFYRLINSIMFRSNYIDLREDK
jgi:hypothetical protein